MTLVLSLTSYIGDADGNGFLPQLGELGRYKMPGEDKDAYSKEEDIQRVRCLAHIRIIMVHSWDSSGGDTV